MHIIPPDIPTSPTHTMSPPPFSTTPSKNPSPSNNTETYTTIDTNTRDTIVVEDVNDAKNDGDLDTALSSTQTPLYTNIPTIIPTLYDNESTHPATKIIDTPPTTNEPTPQLIPTLPTQSQYSSPSTLPKLVKLTPDDLSKCIGFWDTTTLQKHIHTIAQPNIHITNIDPEPIINLGKVATIEKHKQNNSPLPLPDNFGDAIHMDIGFGSKTSIAGVKYCLFLVDRVTRYKFIYPLQNLTTDLLCAFKKFK